MEQDHADLEMSWNLSSIRSCQSTEFHTHFDPANSGPQSQATQEHGEMAADERQ
jgi:hypothetical protein